MLPITANASASASAIAASPARLMGRSPAPGGAQQLDPSPRQGLLLIRLPSGRRRLADGPGQLRVEGHPTAGTVHDAERARHHHQLPRHEVSGGTQAQALACNHQVGERISAGSNIWSCHGAFHQLPQSLRSDILATPGINAGSAPEMSLSGTYACLV